MKLDQEPEQRYLLYHPESDCLFEAVNGQAEEYLSCGEVEDVTCDPIFETRFRERGV